MKLFTFAIILAGIIAYTCKVRVVESDAMAQRDREVPVKPGNKCILQIERSANGRFAGGYAIVVEESIEKIVESFGPNSANQPAFHLSGTVRNLVESGICESAELRWVQN